jgi:nicotinamidase/pyrazinamidase
MPGGALPVPDGDRIVPIILDICGDFDVLIFTKDWHPANHCSFKENGGIWPVHCVQNTKGAKIHKDLAKLDSAAGPIIVCKGQDVNVDSYSGFYDNERKKSTGLTDILKEEDITGSVTDVYICGLALNFCVKFTALDAVQEGFKTYVIEDACRGIDINPGDVQKAIEEMKKNGIKMINANNLMGD